MRTVRALPLRSRVASAKTHILIFFYPPKNISKNRVCVFSKFSGSLSVSLLRDHGLRSAGVLQRDVRFRPKSRDTFCCTDDNTLDKDAVRL